MRYVFELNYAELNRLKKVDDPFGAESDTKARELGREKWKKAGEKRRNAKLVKVDLGRRNIIANYP